MWWMPEVVLSSSRSPMGARGMTYYDRYIISAECTTVHCRNVRGLGKSVVVFRLFEKLRYSDERSTKFESPKQD